MDDTALTNELLERDLVFKAEIIGEVETTTSDLPVQPSTESATFDSDTVEPPYLVGALCRRFEDTAHLRPSIDALVVNIDGFGHHFEPVVDLDDARADQIIAEAIVLGRMLDQPIDPKENEREEVLAEPLTAEVKAKREEITRRLRYEKGLLENFFASCTNGYSFVELRKRSRYDREITGMSYWELIRDRQGRLVEFNHVPAKNVRLRKLGEPVEVDRLVRVSLFEYTRIKAQQRFRSFVQEVDGKKVYFKEQGDPRFLSRKTGRFYKTLRVLQRDEGKSAEAANEMIAWSIYSSNGVYGIPRYIGALLSVLGSRAADFINYLYMDNKSVPPMAILVNGGRLREDAVKKIERYIRDNIKGRGNFWNVLIIEAEGPSDPIGGQVDRSSVRIELKPLMQAQPSDALFQKYDERNADKIASMFRVPKILRGDVKDYNKASALASLMFADPQIFAPEREEFDFTIQQRILLQELGVKLWRFKSNAPTTSDPEVVTTIVKTLMTVGVLTPDEGREIAERILNKNLKKIDAAWVNQPLQLTMAGILVQDEDVIDPSVATNDSPSGPDVGVGPQTKRRSRKKNGATADVGADGVLRLKIPVDKFHELIESEPSKA